MLWPHAVALPPLLGVALAFALPLISLAVKDRRVWEGYAVAATALIAGLCSYVAYAQYVVLAEPTVYMFGGWPPPVGIVYEVDRLNALLGALVSWVVLLAAVYSVRYMEGEDGVEWYYTLLLGFEAGMVGCLYTGDLFNLFVMLEVMSVSAYGLVAFRRDAYEAVEAAVKYAIVGSLATTLYFIAIAFGYGSFGTLNMADMAAKAVGMRFPVTGAVYSPVGWTLGAGAFLAFMFWAFAVKAAIAPNHFWLPDAHPAAPSPISALLSGLMVKVALIGGFLLIVQSDVKRLIAYGTVLNVGYITMALGLGGLSPHTGLTAAIYHIINHGVAKALLFLCAGSFIHASGARHLDELAGVGRRMPWTSAFFTIGALALAGVPPLNCFMSKLILMQGLLESWWLSPLVVVVVLTSALALIGYLKVVYNVYMRPPVADISWVREAPRSMLAPTFILAVACVVLGLIGPVFVERVVEPAVASALDLRGYVEAAYEKALLLHGGG
ncbi:cation:proton antiporter [Candidatus Geothermarchaeota archaeon ex4572_27]|nr:MAG: cation:proton antiporter [Candidatus Geothermarchaeota archaeon ex4572_27]